MPASPCNPDSDKDAIEYLEYLKVEAEHFYKSELHSEQRASWLLTIAIGIQALVLNTFIQIFEKKVNRQAEPALVTSSILLFLAVGFALWTIWPLKGRRAALSLPWRTMRRPTSRLSSRPSLTLWEEHYEAHRRRAELKMTRVVWTLLSLLAGVGAGVIALILNSGIT